MDIDKHVNQIVQNIIEEITTKVQLQAAQAIEQKIAEVIASIDSNAIISEKINQKLDAKMANLPIDANSIETVLKSKVMDMANNLAATVQARALESSTELIQTQLKQLDFATLFYGTVVNAIKNKQLTFPDGSIPLSAVQTGELTLSGNAIKGGIIENFGSLGIDDKALTCQVSIFDEVTVVENNLVTRDLTVKGTTTIEGDLNVTGTVPESSPLFISVVNAATRNVRTSLDQTVFQKYADLVFSQIKEQGIDLVKIKLNGTDIFNGGHLGDYITSSNLRKVGALSELQVTGESFLSQTLYTTVKRVGINTIEPSQVLSIWDNEVEIGFGKHSANTGIIEVPRTQNLVLSSNGKNNITLTPDGAVAVNQLSIGIVKISVSDSPPSNDQPKGTIVLNSNPSLGGPVGWVSLGEARWGNFGVID